MTRPDHLFPRAALAAFTLWFAMPLAAQAPSQCALTEYIVTGTVVAAGDVPVAGARLTAQWEEGPGGGLATTRARSGPDGRFTVNVQFDTYSGQTFSGKQKCEAVLESVVLQVAAEGYRELRRSAELGPEPVNIKLELRAQ